MKSLLSSILILPLALFGVCGCISRNPKVPIHFYSLKGRWDLPQTSRSSKLPSLGVYGFDSSSCIETRMLYRVSEVEVGYYEYDRWVDLPSDTATRAFVQGLSTSGLFSRVHHAEKFPHESLSWILTGTLEKFEEDHTTNPPSAHISVNLEIYQAKQFKEIWKKSISARESLEGDSAVDLVNAMDKALRQILYRAEAEMEQIPAGEK